jgi:hypothetical protein
MRLLYLEASQIETALAEYDRNTKAIKDELLRICWFMRGSIGYNESHMLTPDEKEIVSKLIEDNLATTKESGLPFF